MPDFKVTITLEDGTIIKEKTTPAENCHDALWKVLDEFKSDPHVADAKSWIVKVQEVPDQ